MSTNHMSQSQSNSGAACAPLPHSDKFTLECMCFSISPKADSASKSLAFLQESCVSPSTLSVPSASFCNPHTASESWCMQQHSEIEDSLAKSNSVAPARHLWHSRASAKQDFWNSSTEAIMLWMHVSGCLFPSRWLNTSCLVSLWP